MEENDNEFIENCLNNLNNQGFEKLCWANQIVLVEQLLKNNQTEKLLEPTTISLGLIQAIRENNFEMVKLLTLYGANINFKDNDNGNISALEVALNYNYEDIINHLCLVSDSQIIPQMDDIAEESDPFAQQIEAFRQAHNLVDVNFDVNHETNVNNPSWASQLGNGSVNEDDDVQMSKGLSRDEISESAPVDQLWHDFLDNAERNKQKKQLLENSIDNELLHDFIDDAELNKEGTQLPENTPVDESSHHFINDAECNRNKQSMDELKRNYMILRQMALDATIAGKMKEKLDEIQEKHNPKAIDLRFDVNVDKPSFFSQVPIVELLFKQQIREEALSNFRLNNKSNFSPKR